MSLVDVAGVPDLLELPPDALDVLVRERPVRVLRVEPHADAGGERRPVLDVAEHGVAAALVERGDAVVLDLVLVGDPELLLHLDLDGEPVTVPPGFPRDVVAAHGLESWVEVFERARPHVVEPRTAVGGGGTLVEDPLGGAFAAAEALGEDIVFAPPCEHRLFERDEVECGHGIERHPCTLRAPPEALRTEMAHWNDCYTVERDAVVLRVHVQPSAGRTAIVGRHGDAVKLRVASPPVDDRANVAVGELLADLFGIEAGDVELVSGGKSA